MSEANAELDDLIDRASDGDENALHTLFDLPDAELEIVIARFRGEESPRKREVIVEAVWQHRRPQDLGFLLCAVDDSAEVVWKQALDGIVTLGGEEARVELERLRSALDGNDPRTPWIDEALQQLGSV